MYQIEYPQFFSARINFITLLKKFVHQYIQWVNYTTIKKSRVMMAGGKTTITLTLSCTSPPAPGGTKFQTPPTRGVNIRYSIVNKVGTT
jgi:hypothetical protein